MTSKGFMTPINKQGITKGDIGPLAKCSFEDTTDQLIKSSVFGERDMLQGVSSNIMMGQNIHAGTNNCEILLDEEKLFEELLQQSDLDGEEQSQIQDMYDVEKHLTSVEQDELCDIDEFKMSIE